MTKFPVTGNWFFYLLFCLSLALTWFFHRDSARFSDRNGLWSDRAGYYIYLPATFFYHFDTRKMPADLDVQTGGGFSIDTVNNKLDTKYTYGVALLASPFFIASGLISRVAGYESESGFSMIYMRMMGLAAVIYLILGLWFLKKFLDPYFKPAVSCLVITLIFLGTNLFYYALIDGMMSHVYSFFLFALFLFALQRFLHDRSSKYFILLSLVFAIAVLIRPTNILLGILFFTWDAGALREWGNRARYLLKPSNLPWFLVILFIVFLPQLVYWKYLSGSWIHFSYRGEGFINWRHPRITEVLFSPVNGLFTYTPLALIFLAGIVMMIVRKRANGWLTGVIFILVTLVCASWKMWYFGCSYGQRSFIEYYAILAVPLAWFITWMLDSRFFLVKTLLMFLLVFMVYANLRYTVVLYRYDRCYYGSTWDWDFYRRSFERAGVISPVHPVRSYENDFENLALCPVRKPSMIFTHSGQYSISAIEKEGITPLYSTTLETFSYPYPKTMELSLWMLTNSRRPTGASIGYTVKKDGKLLFSEEQPADPVSEPPGTWYLVRKTLILPDVTGPGVQIDIFITNWQRANLYADDLGLKFNYKWN